MMRSKYLNKQTVYDSKYICANVKWGRLKLSITTQEVILVIFSLHFLQYRVDWQLLAALVLE